MDSILPHKEFLIRNSAGEERKVFTKSPARFSQDSNPRKVITERCRRREDVTFEKELSMRRK